MDQPSSSPPAAGAGAPPQPIIGHNPAAGGGLNWRRWLSRLVVLLILIGGAWLLFFRTTKIDYSQPMAFCVDGSQNYTTPVSNFYGDSSNYITTRVVRSFVSQGDVFYVAKVSDVTNVYAAHATNLPADATKHTLKAGAC